MNLLHFEIDRFSLSVDQLFSPQSYRNTDQPEVIVSMEAHWFSYKTICNFSQKKQWFAPSPHSLTGRRPFWVCGPHVFPPTAVRPSRLWFDWCLSLCPVMDPVTRPGWTPPSPYVSCRDRLQPPTTRHGSLVWPTHGWMDGYLFSGTKRELFQLLV